MESVKAKYHIQPDGSISKYKGEDNFIAFHMTLKNSLMVEEIAVKNISMELALKAILMAQTEFMVQFGIPEFSSELETKDVNGVIERFSNMPGRSVARRESTEEEVVAALGLSGRILADAAGTASKAAMTAAEAASVANANAAQQAAANNVASNNVNTNK